MPLDFPSPSVSTTYTDSTSGNTYTFANGSWSLLSILSATKGGTGFASYNRGDILFGNASGTLSKLGAGTAGSVLSTNGTGADPTWIAMSVSGGAGTVATPGARYQIAGYYPGTGASVSGSSTFTNDTSTGIVSITHATTSISTTSGALVITGGVGIGASVNIGGRVGINTGVYTGAFNITTPSASTPGLVVQGSASQTADYLRVLSSAGTTSFLLNSSFQLAWPDIGTLKVYGAAYSSQGRLQVDGCLSIATGPFLIDTGIGQASMTSSALSFAGGIGLGTYSTNTLSTNNPFRVQPTDTGVIPIVINAQNASWTSGNLFLIQNNGSNVFSVNFAGSTAILSTVASGSTTTGALVVSGGVGIGGSLNVYNLSKFSDHLEIKTQKELRLYNSADSFYTALKAGAVASSSKTFTLPINYGTAGQFLYTTDTSGTLDWRSDPVQVSSGSVNEIAYYASAGNTVSGSSTFTNNASGGVVSITHGTASTGFSSGALVVTGGVGIGGSLRIGDSTTSGGTTTGALTVRGGVGIGNNLYVGGLLSVSGTTNLFGAIVFQNELSTLTIQNRIIKSGSIALSMSSTNLNGAVLQIQQANIKETGIGTGSNVTSVMPAISFRKQTFSSTNASITYSKAANVYIEDAPDSSVTGAVGSGGTNTVTITNSYALYVENGRTYMGGALDAPGSYRCSIGLATDQTITSGSDALVNFTSISDPNSWWNATTKRLTPTIAGWYYVSFQVNWDAASITNNQCNIQMRKNAGTFSIGQMQLLSGNAYSMSCSGMVNVNGSSDYLDFTVYTSNTTSQVLNGEASQQFTRVDMFKIQ
jgi:hypothetical protein